MDLCVEVRFVKEYFNMSIRNHRASDGQRWEEERK